MTDSKKARERQFLEEVAELYPDFPQGEIIEGESPDFLIRQDTYGTGVEIVDYVRGQNKGVSAERRNEVLWQKIADVARHEFESKHSDPLLIHFMWNHHYLLRQTEILQLAQESTKLIETHIPVGLFETMQIDSDEMEGSILEGVCHSISVTRVRNSKQTLWSFVNAGFIEVKANELQYLIDSKNDKIQEYLGLCETVWLVIVADGRFISSNIDLTSLTAHNVYSSMFEQVLVYDRVNKRVHQLQHRRA